MEKVIFLDRDGTLNEEVNYLHRKEDLVLLPGVPEALKALRTRATGWWWSPIRQAWPAAIIPRTM